MCEAEQRFIEELEKEIGDHPEKANILQDYKLHIHELLKEESTKKQEVYDLLINRLGTPRKIAKIWKQEIGVTPKKTQWLFVICNIFIFLGGTILTISYNVFHWDWLENLWLIITESTFLIMFVYILFWGLLGYEIGKEFGHRGYRLLRNTFLLSVIPNVLLMYLVIFNIFPYEWFRPLLNFRFIMICIIFTFLLYPVSYVGYRWGRKVSV